MYPLGLGVVSWWWIAILATAVFLAVLVPGMPTREHRIMTALAPLAGAVFMFASYHVKHMEPAEALVMYTTVVLIAPLGMIGHRRELARRLMEAKEKGESEEKVAPIAMNVQLLVSVVVLGVAMFWITR
ncbi:hypothetical protein [Kitasatospora sp. NPDC088351]|uniref:hypothetical protein n=1 Tax=unclassified Kitasatospora TaxID=2633591 RepID=UPI00342580AB